jgi:uncharacterized damage-inducible protein DinB
MTDAPALFVQHSRSLLTDDYLPRIERSVAVLSDEDVWWRSNAASNSVGNLILHLCGNVTEWIIGGVGQRPYERHRQQEFDARESLSASGLLARLNAVVFEADAVLAGLEPSSLVARRHIQGYDVSVLEAIYHVVEHFSMHTGQIIVIAKARSGADLKLWQPPTPRALDQE